MILDSHRWFACHISRCCSRQIEGIFWAKQQGRITPAQRALRVPPCSLHTLSLSDLRSFSCCCCCPETLHPAASMHSPRLTRAALLLLVPAVIAQTSTISSVAPAATTVSTSDTAAAAPLSADEAVQLTDSVIASLNATIANASTVALFDFASNDTDSATKRSTSSCKVFPGDAAWPSTLIWDLFDLLLGGALIKTIPSAASCYSSWGVYSPSQCSYVSSEWTDSYFHMDDPTSVMWPLYEVSSSLGSKLEDGISSTSSLQHLTNIDRGEPACQTGITSPTRVPLEPTRSMR